MVLSVVMTAFPAPAGDFTGTYTLGAPGAAGKDVQVTILLSLANNTSSSIGNATISLHEPKAGRVIYGKLSGLSLAAGASTPVSGSFRIPRPLYDSWQKGSSPAISVSYNDAQGNPVQSFIQF
jgi:hypothetical protein